MRSEIEIENEWYFGLQEHSTAESAFRVAQGDWADAKGKKAFKSIEIMTDESFVKIVRQRVLFRYLDYRRGEIPLAVYCVEVSLHPTTVSNYLLNFDFFLWSKKMEKFYTCRASFDEENYYIWNDRQKGYYQTLKDAFDFPALARETQTLVEKALQMMGIKEDVKLDDKTIDALFDFLFSEEGKFASDIIFF